MLIKVVDQCIPCHTDIEGEVCNGHGTCTNSSIHIITHNGTNGTNATKSLQGECVCDQYWTYNPNPKKRQHNWQCRYASPRTGVITSLGSYCVYSIWRAYSYELFHNWILVTVAPAGGIIVIVILILCFQRQICRMLRCKAPCPKKTPQEEPLLDPTQQQKQDDATVTSKSKGTQFDMFAFHVMPCGS